MIKTSLCSLETALLYKNDNVLHKFRESYAVSMAEARDIFTETGRWLWLCAYTQSLKESERARVAPPLLVVSEEILILDEMWHTFILFTKEYTDYCLEHFGHYIHHAPTTHAIKVSMGKQMKAAPAAFMRKRRAGMEKQYGYIYDVLGEETLLKWYREYPARYSLAKMTALFRSVN